MPLVIQQRKKLLVNTDPQNRWYNGVPFSAEMMWGYWNTLHTTAPDRAEDDLKFWQDLPKSTTVEYKIKELS